MAAATGIDTLTHALEAYLNPNGTDASEAASLGAIRLVFKHLRPFVANTRSIENAQIQGKMVLLTAGLQAGDKLIVSDVFPAIPGMQVQMTLKTTLEESIADWVKEQ